MEAFRNLQRLIALPLSSITDADIAALSFWHLQDFCQAKTIDADSEEEEEVRERVRVIILLPLSSITNANIASLSYQHLLVFCSVRNTDINYEEEWVNLEMMMMMMRRRRRNLLPLTWKRPLLLQQRLPTLSIVITICRKRLCLLNVDVAVVIVAGCTTKVNGIVLTNSNFMSPKPRTKMTTSHTIAQYVRVPVFTTRLTSFKDLASVLAQPDREM